MMGTDTGSESGGSSVLVGCFDQTLSLADGYLAVVPCICKEILD